MVSNINIKVENDASLHPFFYSDIYYKIPNYFLLVPPIGGPALHANCKVL